MDNITQGITGLAIAKLCLCNTKADKYWWRFVITFFCLTNLSDIDIILRFWSHELYFEQHRGYTHSLLGLLTIVPLGMWIIKKVYQDKVEFTLKQLFITSFSVTFFGHILLDYLTIYGIQLFWPYDVTHYDYSLIFIIDIIMWLVAIVIGILRWRKYNTIKLSIAYLSIFAFLMSSYFIQRQYIIHNFSNFYNVKKVYYSAFLNPFYKTTVFGFDDNGNVVQAVYSIFDMIDKKDPRTTKDYPYISKKYSVNKLPDNGRYNDNGKEKFRRYQAMGIIIICEPINNGAHCFSLKYFSPSFNSGLISRIPLSRKIYFNH